MKQHNSHNDGTFAPTRLTVAREIRGLTRKALADLVGVTAPAITQFESATNGPELRTIHQMAAALGFPVRYFFGPDVNLIEQEGLTFRSRRSMTLVLRVKARAAAVIVASIISPALRRRFNLPLPAIPDLSEHTPSDAAALLRHQWSLGYGPISNMVHLLESRGVETYWHREEASSLDAFSWWEDDQPFVMLNTAKQGGDRGRYDAAHELAHLVIHQGVKDMDSRQVEMEANQFASAFLMPVEQFRMESPRYPVLEHYKSLKKRWGVSLSAMVRRSRDLLILSDWQYECACREIAVKGWKTSEPWGIIREQSQVHQFVFERLLEKDITPERFAGMLDLSFSQLETTMPVATKFHEQSIYGSDVYSLETLRQVDAEQSQGNHRTS